MTYTAPDAGTFRKVGGTLAQKICNELSDIETEFTSVSGEFTKNNSKYAVLTAGVGTNTALATAGIDLASGSDIQIYGVFFAPVNITVVTLHYYLTEAYVKDTNADDAKIELYNDASSPVKIFGATLAAAGVAAKTHGEIAPESGKAAIAEGTRLDLKVVNTGSSSGTGHAIVILEYVET
jgi:hypothetical protein